jgi:hypothetical protein
MRPPIEIRFGFLTVRFVSSVDQGEPSPSRIFPISGAFELSPALYTFRESF